MQDEPPARRVGPLQTPKAFRRETGAHGIIAQIALADSVGVLVWMLIGSLLGPPTWWVLREAVHLLHASLLLDCGLLLLGACLIGGIFRQRVLKKPSEEAWITVGPIIIFIFLVLGLLWLIRPDWMAISAPGSVIPNYPVEAPSWRVVFVPQGAAIAAVLSLLAHILVLRRARNDSETTLLVFSRTHPDGSIARFLEQIYDVYRRELHRFDPPPLFPLKTPATIYYYQHDPDATDPRSSEQDVYWHAGHLIINRALIGPKPEQSNVLLPLLARHIYDCNTADRFVAFLFRLAHSAERSWLTSWVLTVPLYTIKNCEQQWQAQERDRVLDRDWGAYLCGQGRRLRKLLRQELEDRTQRNLPDNAIPALAERLDYLDGILAKEERQVQRLRDALPPENPEDLHE